MNVEKKVQPGTRVQDQIINAVERAELRTRPFDHIAMTGVLEPSTYHRLLEHMPDRRFYHELKHQDALRSDGSSTRLRMYLYPELLRLLPRKQQELWVAVADALCSRELELALKHKFRAALEERFGKPVEKIGLYAIPILLRDQPGYRIGIHSDVKRKAITVQFYLPADERQAHVGTLFHESNEGEGANRTVQIPFLPSTGYAFPVALTKSWHSAATTAAEEGERVSMMVTYYVADSIVRRLYWKVRRGLLSLGIHSKH